MWTAKLRHHDHSNEYVFPWSFECSLEVLTHRTNIPAVVTTAIKSGHWSQWVGIFGLVLLFAALRWNNYAAPLGRDEGEYAYSAQLLIQGIAPYDHAYIQKPPGVVYSYALADLLFPRVFWSPHLLAAAFVALTTVLLGFIARLEFGEGYALPVMWLATPMILLPGLDLVDANVEVFMLLPMVATVAMYCYSRQHGNKDKHWFWAGFLAAATLLYKYTALPILGFVFLAWLFERWRQGTKANLMVRALACAIAGGILAAVLELAFFLIHDGGRTFWECTVVFNRYYVGTSNFALSYFWMKCGDFWRNWWILFLIPWLVLLQPRPRLWFWVGIFICSILATNASCYTHYYAVIMPFWALLTAMGIRALASRISKGRGQRWSWIGGLITAAVLALVIYPDVRWMRCTSQQFAVEKSYELPNIEARLIAGLVSQMSTPNDFVFVAGSEPEILSYSQRFSPTRFITSYPLMIPTPLAAGYQHEAINELLQFPPKLIVFGQSGYGWLRQPKTPPDFINFMGRFLRNYKLVGGYAKSDAFNGYWSTNLSVGEYRSASLLLYQRR